MESPTCPKLNPMFEEYLTKRLKEYADAKVRTTQEIKRASQEVLDRYDNSLSPEVPMHQGERSPDEESIDDGFSGSVSGSYLSTASCPASPSPARHRFNYRPQRPTYDPTRGILKSINEGNTRRLSKLLGRRSSNAASLEDLTAPLTQAIRLGQDKCVISLLSAGADPNGLDDEGKTPLYLLMEVGGGNPEILRILLKFRANPDLATWNMKHTPLHLASKKGLQVSVKLLLAANAKPNLKDAAGNTPVMFAAKEGHVNIVRALVKGGADPNAKNLTNESPVHYAARGGTLDCLKELLELGADPDDRDTRGQTPLILACKGKQTKMVEILLDYECDVNGQDTNTGKTALHWAVQNAETNIVTELLDAGADPNIKDKNWATPFMLALTAGKTDILDMLLHAGCDVISMDRSGNTALHLAATEGQANLISSLVEAGINVDLKGPSGVTSIMLAAFGGHVSTIRELLKFGANPNLLDRNRASALMYAILSKGNEGQIHEMVKLLIRTNCDLDYCANLAKILQHLDISLGDNIDVEERLYSPLEVAYLRGKTAVFMMLIKAGADSGSFKGDVMPFVSDRRPPEGDQRNRWYMLHCLKKDKEEIKSLMELCRRPALQFLTKQFKGRSQTLMQKISQMPFGERLKSFLAYEDINEVESKYNVNLRDRQQESSVSNTPPTRQTPNPKNAGIHSLRSSFRRSSGFTRNSSARQSLPVGYYNQSGPLASSTPTKSTPTRTNNTSGMSNSSLASRGPSKRHSITYDDRSSLHTQVSSRHQSNGSSTTLSRADPYQTSTLPRQRRNQYQNGVTNKAGLGPRTGSSNNLELTRSMENRLQANTPTLQYGSLRTRKVKKETEHEKMAKAYDDLRNSMIAAGSISDVSSSSSSLSESKQKVPKRRGRYGKIDPTQMLSSPTPSSDNDVFFNGDISPRSGSDVSSPRSGPLSPRASVTSPSPGPLSPRAGVTPPSSGLLGPRDSVTSPSAGLRSPRTSESSVSAGPLSPQARSTSPNAGPLSPRTRTTSSRVGPMSPRANAASLTAGKLNTRVSANSPVAGPPRSRSGATSPTDSMRSSTEDNSSKQRSTLKYRNMYNNNLGIPTAMVSPTVAEIKKDREEEKQPAPEKTADEWGLKCLRTQRSVASTIPPAPEIIAMDDQEKKLLENIVKETEEKLKEHKTYVPPDERPMKPMSEETRKAIYDKRWARIPNPAIIGDLQFSRNGIKSPRTSTSEDLNSPVPTSPRTSGTNEQKVDQNLRSSLRPSGSPTGLEKKEVRFSPSSERLANSSSAIKVQRQNGIKQESELDDSAIQRWGTMTLDDPEVLDNSENFTSSKSLESPTGKRAFARTSKNNNSGPAESSPQISKPVTSPPPTSSFPRTSVPTHFSPPDLSPRSKTRSGTGGHYKRNSYNAEELDNRQYHNEDSRNRNIYSVDFHSNPADHENRNTSTSFSRNLRPYSSLRIRGPHANYSSSPMSVDDYTSSLERSSRKRSGMRSRDHPSSITDTSLTSPAEKKDVWFDGPIENAKPEAKKNTAGSKIKMAFLRSKTLKR